MENLSNYLILFIVMAAMFIRGLRCGYVVDDDYWMQKMAERKKLFKEGKFPLQKLIWFSCYGAGIFRNAVEEHLFNLTIHFINCCLIFKMSGSLLAAVLYMVNPVNNQTVLWLNGRRYAISILCVLLCWNFKWLAIVLYPFAMWIHVSAAGFPLLFLMDGWGIGIPIILIGVAMFFSEGHLKTFAFRKSEFTAFNESQALHWRKGILYVKSIGYYFFHCLLPVRPAMYQEFLYYFSRYPDENKRGYSLNFDFWKGALVLTGLGYLLITQHNFWALWFLVFISQWSNIITVTMTAADRYCSLPSVGVMILASQYLTQIPEPFNWITATALITFYVMKYQPLFRAYGSVEDFHFYHMNLNPAGVESRSILATRYVAQGDPMSAYAVLKKGLKYRPKDFKLLIVMAQVMLIIGKVDKGLKILDIAQRNCPLGDEENCRVEFDNIREKFKPRKAPPNKDLCKVA